MGSLSVSAAAFHHICAGVDKAMDSTPYGIAYWPVRLENAAPQSKIMAAGDDQG